jgi:hypothetical protein
MKSFALSATVGLLFALLILVRFPAPHALVGGVVTGALMRASLYLGRRIDARETMRAEAADDDDPGA